jgi:acetyl/propionyl-CoA carboxylase alpha subunit
MDNLFKPTPIHKILVANRGEIALRVKRAAQYLHIPTVAVYTDQEADSTWVSQFDESLSMGGGSLSNTYLDIALIISIARKCGADAIHPGYGFLSESHLFARACEENQIRFIGPPSATLKLTGDKLAAHEFVVRLGIPVTDKITDSPDEISRNGHKLDYPVLVKAAAGGGGKGMRIVRSPHELTDVLEIAASEAYHFFADDRVYVEKYLPAPRHIEVQVLGDAYGQIVHLFERECSIQRRHQKVVEEAPAVCLSDGLRERIIDAAMTIARSLQYLNAGTIEFLLDEKENFFFLEINPRIQVEHGITEMLTGIDLVKEQIRIAEGYPLSFSQSDIVCRGHAIEVRIYAENPENDLLPSPGRIHYLKEPASDHIRMESAVSSGSSILPDFDPLIAKIISHGTDRMQAVQFLEKALEDLVITGVHHNVPLIRTILQDEIFLSNRISTTYLQDNSELFLQKIRDLKFKAGTTELIMAAVILAVLSGANTPKDSVWQSFGHWRMVPRLSFRLRGNRHEVYYQRTGPDSMYVWCDRHRHSLTQIQLDEWLVAFTCDEVLFQFYHIPASGGTMVLTRGNIDFELERSDRLKTADFDYMLEEEAAQGIILSPLPGKVSRVSVEMKEKVNRGDNLMIIESMKLENSILAPYAGTVMEIVVSEGEQVKEHDPLLYLAPEES